MIKAVGTDSPVVQYLMRDVIDYVQFVACGATIVALVLGIIGLCWLYDNIKATYEWNTTFSRGHKVSKQDWVAVGILFAGAIIAAVIAVPSVQVALWTSAYNGAETQYNEEVKPALERMEVVCTDDDVKTVSTYIEKWNTSVSRQGRTMFDGLHRKEGYALRKCVDMLGEYEGYNVIANADYDNIKVVLSSKVRENIQATGKYIVDDARPTGDSLDSK